MIGAMPEFHPTCNIPTKANIHSAATPDNPAIITVSRIMSTISYIALELLLLSKSPKVRKLACALKTYLGADTTPNSCMAHISVWGGEGGTHCLHVANKNIDKRKGPPKRSKSFIGLVPILGTLVMLALVQW